MPRRKGKSQRRIKDWGRRLRESAPDSFDADSSETLQPQRVKLPASRLQASGDETLPAEKSSEAEGRLRKKGMVVGLFPGGAIVRLADEDWLCSLAGTFRPPKGASALAVGDEVAVAATPRRGVSGDKTTDKQRTDGMILSRQPRRSLLSRPQAIRPKRRGGKRETFEKVIAANMEVLLIISSVHSPPFRPGLIDRFCIIAERGDMQPIIVINKIDLAKPDKNLLAELTAGGLDVFRCSALTGKGLRKLRAALRDRRSVLAGASGVGKSTLINALVPGANIPVKQIRAKDQRGRHVTSAATLHELPRGGLLVDTPGVRELAVEMAAADLPWYFPELAGLAPQCRFNNCTHTHEPDCAVRAAAEAGAIPLRRYRSYMKILESVISNP